MSKAEYARAYRAKVRETIIKEADTVTCGAKDCNVEFKQFPSSKVYCSNKCASRTKMSRDNRNRRKPIRTVECGYEKCDVIFETRNGMKKFCSTKCKDLVNKNGRKEKDKKFRERKKKANQEAQEEIECNLETCDTKFLSTHGQKFCSKKCRLKSYNVKNLKIIERVCKNEDCKKPFTTNYGQKMYCSSVCQTGEPAKPLVERPCKECGETFMPTVAQGAYCSKRCRMDSANKAKINVRRSNGIMGITAKPKVKKPKAKKPTKKQYTPITVTKVKKEKMKVPKSDIKNDLFMNDEGTVVKKKLAKLDVPADGTYGENDQKWIKEFEKKQNESRT